MDRIRTARSHLEEQPGGWTRFLEALSFAAHKHRDQRRKDQRASPYINHPIDVARTLAEVGGIEDPDLLMAAVLHDTIEDTETTASEIESLFGPLVRQLVEELTDDKSLPKEVRKQRQIEHAPSLSAGAKQLKLADKICNVRDVASNPPSGWPEEQRRGYFDWAEAVAEGCRGVNAALEAELDERLARGRAALGG